MKRTAVRFVVAVGLAGVMGIPAVMAAEEAAKPATLPTLLIKGEVVSQDTSDRAAPLLKVKDRYGFETPIYLMSDTKITQGDQTITASTLSAGTSVEVEYNFDINTAKRKAVNVKVTPSSASALTAAPTASTTATAPAAAASTAAPQQPAASTPASSTGVIGDAVVPTDQPKSTTSK